MNHALFLRISMSRDTVCAQSSPMNFRMMLACMGGKVKGKCKSASMKLLSERRRDIPDTVGELK